jgi:diguanylate cyclase (GGDEF)-like protein
MAAIEDLAIEHQQSQIGGIVTLSIGIATLTPTAEQNPKDLIKLADNSLYQAKELGRNRIVPATAASSSA